MDDMYDVEGTRWLACRVPTGDMLGFKRCEVLPLPKLAAAAPSAQTVVQDGTSAHGVALIAEGGAAAQAVQQFVSDMIPLG